MILFFFCVLGFFFFFFLRLAAGFRLRSFAGCLGLALGFVWDGALFLLVFAKILILAGRLEAELSFYDYEV